ncbi:hypothetical protein DFR29_12173 [Tahibacter aquaticus]|uniref:Uncharacterized protein n=1 Tax=Tahibacter aquaticus TaxID=520092 RepID=A0A4R6YM41_9GAMM|nr:hypothetical protein [Tahibacter aquaticus]TDR38401.1 hypothetical protein DFR29_12173 [Tahibacter aquaticus]
MNRSRLFLLLASLLAAPLVAAAPPEAASTSDDSPVIFHFAGYADVTVTDTQGDAGTLGAVTLAPIFCRLVSAF